MHRKKLAIILVIVLALGVLLIPIRMKLKDGGSVRYKALAYEVTKIHRLTNASDGGYTYVDGYEVKILGLPVYHTVETVTEQE